MRWREELEAKTDLFFELAKAMAKKGYAQISKLKINRDFGLSKISNLKSQISNL